MGKHIIALYVLVYILTSCNIVEKKKWEGECVDAHDIGTIEIISALDNNALRVIFKVETAKKLDSYIRYWEVTDLDSTQGEPCYSYSPLCKNKKDHELMIVNLKPETKYNFNVVIQNEHCKTNSKTYEFTTKKMPPWVPYYANKDSISNLNFDGYIHFHSRKNPGYIYLVNNQGVVIWYKNIPFNIKVSKFTKQSTFLTILSNDTLKFSSGRQIAEVDLFGQLLYHYDSDEEERDLTFHHEIDYDENGNIMTLTYDERIADLSKVGGNISDTVRGDGILVMDKLDNVIWEWSVFDVIQPAEYANILNEKRDWLHANALCKDSLGNYIVSFRNNSQIWKIDKETGKVIWKLGGDDGDFLLTEDQRFYGQHNIHFDKEGNLVLLDNGNRFVKPGLIKMLKEKGLYRKMNKEAEKQFQSRQLTFKIDEVNKKVELVDEICFPKAYFSKSQGSSELINDSLSVFCSTNTNSIVFTGKNGQKCGVIPLEYTSYRVQYIPELYKTDYVK